ncbi:MAG TPA: hypothetical protein VMM92_15365 [Thermoanaerobaculia bacterium]|nr:hypothetical protein [Thermoanaerobaculia bacterium]
MLRVFWQEGQVLSELGDLDAAESALLAARRGFLQKKLAPEWVAASRDLANLYRRLGRWRDVEQTVLAAQAFFLSAPAEPEVQRSLDELAQLTM